MISINTRFESIVLKTQVEVEVYLPNPENFMHQVTDFKERYTFAPFKTLFLLHGLMDSGRQWIENTSIARIAQDAGIALVIPSCGNNFYVNTIYGMAYSDFLSQELIGFVRAMFPLSEKREDNYIWGISMGGYGALRQAFMHPEMFSRAIAMSPTSDVEFSARFATAMGVKTDYIIGDWRTLDGSGLDLKVIAAQAVREAGAENIPQMLMIIADQDHMVRDNTAFRDCITKLGIANEFHTYPGDHTWRFWDAHVQKCIDWLITGSVGD